MTDWTRVIDDALVGTRDTKPADGVFAGHSLEQALLKQLAMLGAQRRAGYVSASVKHAPQEPHAPPETLPHCSMRAMEWLHTLMANSYYWPVALHWFVHIADRRERVPHRELSYVLNLANTHPTGTPYIVPVIGERGKWMVERSNGYKTIKENQWQDRERPHAPTSAIQSTETHLLELLEQMLKDLSHE